MSSCPTCGDPLADNAKKGSGLCRRCIVVQMMGQADPLNLISEADEDDYDLLEEIGRGGDGTVFRAIEKKMGREVAVKLISTMRCADRGSEERFRAEAEAIASLDHPHIIPIYAFGEMNRRHFYSMKYLAGGNLATRMGEFPSRKTATALMAKIARAVHHAHQRGILHRDIKPSNIILGEDDEPYLSDFGLAKRTSEKTNLTISGSMIGTPAYMSPEQARGDRTSITTSSDVFSLGSVLYHLMTGRPPFEGDNPPAILREVIEKEIRFSGGKSDSQNRDLQNICLKCLRKEPEKRYSTALRLAEDLERAHQGIPVKARPLSEAERLTRWIKRRPKISAAIAITALALIFASLVSTWFWQKAVKGREHADQLTAIAEENEHYATLANAMSARERWDFGTARRLLADIPETRRNFEWRLVNHLSKGDQSWTSDFSPATPLHLTSLSNHQKLLLLTDDAVIHSLDPETGQATPLGKIPRLSSSTKPNLTSFSFSPDEQFYVVIDGSDLLLVEAQTATLKHHIPLHPGAEAAWIDHDLLIFTDGTGRASVYHLSSGNTEVLPGTDYNGPVATSSTPKYLALARSENQLHVYLISQDLADPASDILVREGRIDSIAFNDTSYLAATWVSEMTELALFILGREAGYVTQRWPTPVKMALPPKGNRAFLSFAGSEPWITTLQPEVWHEQTETFDDGHFNSTPFQLGGPFAPPSRLLTRTTSLKRKQFHFGHGSPVNSLTYLLSDDEPTLFSASSDGSVRRWPVRNSKKEHLFTDPTRKGYVSSKINEDHPAASPSGDLVLYRSAKTGYQEIWHRHSPRPTRPPPDELCLAALDGNQILCLNLHQKILSCYHLPESNKYSLLWKIPVSSSAENLGPILSHALTPDQSTLTLLHPGSITLIDLIERTFHTTTLAPDAGGRSIALSPDGQLIAITGPPSQSAQLYHRHKLNQPPQNLPHTQASTVCTFSSDGQKLYLGDHLGKVRVFQTATQAELPKEAWQAHGSAVTAIAVTQSTDLIATAGGNQTILWSAENISRRKRLSLSTGPIARNWLQFSRQDTLLFHSAPNRPIEAWEAPLPHQKTTPLPLPDFQTPLLEESILSFNFDKGMDGWTNLTQPTRNPGFMNKVKGISQHPCSFTSKKSHTYQVVGYPGDQCLTLLDNSGRGIRDSPQSQPIWARSPEFPLSDYSTVSFSLLGGARGSQPPLLDTDPSLLTESTPTGWVGLALRRARDGAYLLTSQRSYDGDRHWERMHWTSAQLNKAIGNDEPEERYTLDLIDTRHGTWSWISLDHVRISAGE